MRRDVAAQALVRAVPRVRALATRLPLELGQAIRTERRRRRWTIDELGRRAGISSALVQAAESGVPTTLEGYVRIAVALNLQPQFELLAERATHSARQADPVHSAMGECEAGQLRPFPIELFLDEPYQHYQFAGRADLLAFDRARRSLLHIENRTLFPDIQAFVGSYNAKRAYLADSIAARLGLARGPRGFASITHVVVALWSSEVVHTVRLRTETFRAVAPDGTQAFAAWWSGTPPASGIASTFVLFDPLTGSRKDRRRWVGLDEVGRVEPRYRDYATALAALRTAGRA